MFSNFQSFLDGPVDVEYVYQINKSPPRASFKSRASGQVVQISQCSVSHPLSQKPSHPMS